LGKIGEGWGDINCILLEVKEGRGSGGGYRLIRGIKRAGRTLYNYSTIVLFCKGEKIFTAEQQGYSRGDAECDRKSLGEKKSTKTPDRSY
jgi:hypothetical protein